MTDDPTKQNNDQYLEDLLGKGLVEYSAVDPRPGLESRILANIQEERSTTITPAWSFASWLSPQMRWAGAVAVLILAAGLSWKLMPSSSETNTQKPSQVITSAGTETMDPEVRPALGTKNNPNTSHPRSVISPTTQYPTQTELAVAQEPVRLAVFPSPSPLTDQEKLMLAYMKQTNRNELIAQSHIDPPLDIRTEDAPTPDKNRIPDESRQARPASGIENVKN